MYDGMLQHYVDEYRPEILYDPNAPPDPNLIPAERIKKDIQRLRESGALAELEPDWVREERKREHLKRLRRPPRWGIKMLNEL